MAASRGPALTRDQRQGPSIEALQRGGAMMIERTDVALPHAIGAVLTNMGNQIGGTFLAAGSTFSLGALFVSLALFVIIVLAGKRRRPIRPAALVRALFPRRLFRTESGRTDLAFFIGGILFSGMTIGWAVFAADDVRRAIERWAGPPPSAIVPSWAGMAIVTFSLFIAYEFAYWLDHWLKHRVAFFWQFHKVHHQAESLSLLTNARVHPVDTIIFYNIAAVVTGATAALVEQLTGGGVGPLAIGGTNALVMLSAVAITHLQHSHLWVRFGERGGKWLLGPAHHQIHHSADPEHFDRNFGSSLAVFDRLFGTFFAPPERRGAIRFGVDDGEPNPHGWRATLFTPFVAAIALMMPRTGARVRHRLTE